MDLNNAYIRKWHIIGVAFTLAAGTALHFLCNWTDWIGAVIFGPVNESIWEHLKLLFWPILLMTAAEYMAYGNARSNFIQAKISGLLVGLIMIPVLYYATAPFVGTDCLVVNLLIFVLATCAAWWISYKCLISGKGASPVSAAAAILLFTSLALLFVSFTFSPPQRELFRDPLTGTYGLSE
jgi:hypothetical protein